MGVPILNPAPRLRALARETTALLELFGIADEHGFKRTICGFYGRRSRHSPRLDIFFVELRRRIKLPYLALWRRLGFGIAHHRTARRPPRCKRHRFGRTFNRRGFLDPGRRVDLLDRSRLSRFRCTRSVALELAGAAARSAAIPIVAPWATLA